MNIPPELVVISLILIVIIYYNSRKKSKDFKVYKHRTKGYKAVKVGIAWLATIFMPIWFLFRGLWSIFFTYIILIFIAVAIDEARYGEYNSIDFNNASNEDFIWVAIQFIIFILPLFKGNDWTAKHLVKKGYLLIDSVDAISKENAIAIVLENTSNSSYKINDTQPRQSKEIIKKKVVIKPKSSKINKKNDKAAKEFVKETIQNIEYVVIRKTLNKFIKSEENAKDLYAFLYGVALFTWSIHKVKMDYEDFSIIFDIVDSSLNDSGINIPRHLDIDDDYDEISSGFVNIYSESIGMNSIKNDGDLIASVNKDFQTVGAYYARAYSKKDKDLERVYFVKLVNTISENT